MSKNSVTRWLLASALGMAGLAPSLPAQDAKPDAKQEGKPAADAKAEYDKRYAAVDKKDAKALFELAKWADANGLKTDSKKLLRDVIKIDPEHAEARSMLGYVKVGDKWLTSREATREKEKAEEAEKASKGLKKWKGEWVPKDDYEKLEKGLVKYQPEGGAAKWVTPEQKERLEKGMKLVDGLWLTADDVTHLKAGQFKVGDAYVNEEEANTKHADFMNAWQLESDFCVLTTTCKYKFGKEALKHADLSIKKAYEIIGLPAPVADDFQKVTVFMVKDIADYKQLGNTQGLDAFDSALSTYWSSFITTDSTTNRSTGVTIYEVIDEGNQQGNDNFSLGHVRFASALAALRNLTFDEPLPAWFTTGVASYCERYWHATFPKESNKLKAWSINAMTKGGPPVSLKTFFDPFQPGSNHPILQAGLVISYLVESNTKAKKIEENWQKTLEQIKAPKKKDSKDLSKAFVRLESALGKDGDKDLEAYIAYVQG